MPPCITNASWYCSGLCALLKPNILNIKDMKNTTMKNVAIFPNCDRRSVLKPGANVAKKDIAKAMIAFTALFLKTFTNCKDPKTIANTKMNGRKN